jgi:nucleotide-binding universal stress UspA family protein
MSWSAGIPALQLEDIDLLEEVDRRLLGTLAARARSAHPGLDVRTELEHDGLVPSLVELGTSAAALVIGTHPGGGPRLGSVLRGVLESAACPVVVVPTDAVA